MLVQFKHMWVAVLTLMILVPLPGRSQSITGEPVDLQFEIINATTDQPGSIERLLLQYSTSTLSPILDIEPSGSLFDVPSVPVLSRGKYVMTAWCQGVPYYWSLRGRDLLETPVKIHVFDTKAGVDDVKIGGLNLLITKTQSLLQLEYMLQIENQAHPQVTLNGEPHVLIKLPANVDKASLIFGNGPDPEEIQLTEFSGGMIALTAPLTSGRNVLRLKTTLQWQDGITIPVGSNVPIEAWSLMATPENLDIQSFDLEPANVDDLKGYLRFKGPAVPADNPFRFRIAGSKGGGEEEDLFTEPAPEAPPAEQESTKSEKEKDKGFPFGVLTTIFVVILAAVASKRRRS